MAENTTGGESSEGTVLLNLIDVAKWDTVHTYCVQNHIPIEDENRRDLTVTLLRTYFEELPPEILGKFRVFNMTEGTKRLKEYRARPMYPRARRSPVIKETAEDDLLVRQLIPDHLLPRVGRR